MFKKLIAIALLCPFLAQANQSTSHYNIEEAKKRCTTYFTESPEIYASDFKWGYTLLEMSDRFLEVYDSGKRLYMHSYYDQSKKEFFIYFNEKEHRPVKLTENFIKSVTLQIETAIEKGYADYVFFPDMGHSHFYFPQKHWDAQYKNFDTSFKNQHLLYEKMMSDPKLEPLYHLAEQLKMQDENKQILEDEIIEFKYWHRNFVGTNNSTGDYKIVIAPSEKKYNTVSSMDGYKSWSAGFAVHASKDGCFPFKDKDGVTRYFDIGLTDPRYDPTSGWGSDPAL